MNNLFTNNSGYDKLIFDNIYYKYHRIIYSNIFKLVRNWGVAEDILQDVFSTLWENRLKIDYKKPVLGWLLIVSRNKSLTYLKKRGKDIIDYVEDYDCYHAITHEIFIDEIIYEYHIKILEEAVNALPPQRKKVFKLCHYEGKTRLETAAILGLSTESVKDYLKHSKNFIKEYITSKYRLGRTL